MLMIILAILKLFIDDRNSFSHEQWEKLQPTVRSFSTLHQALGFLGIEIGPVGMNFSSKNKNANAHLRFDS